MAPDKCCFCNTDVLNKKRWFVMVQRISTIGCGEYGEERRNICDECMVEIRAAIDKLEGGLDSTINIVSGDVREKDS
jgi:hypothetical protein